MRPPAAPKPGWPYCDPKWKRVRRQVLERDGNECQFRKRVKVDGQWVYGLCGEVATAVDHIVPWSKAPALAFDPANLQAACTICNTTKANQGRKDRRRGGTAAPARPARPSRAVADDAVTGMTW